MAKGSEGLSKAFGYLLLDELASLKHVIRGLPPNSVCVNIGAGSGTSGMAFLESQNVGKLHTIDIRRESHPYGGIGNEIEAMKESGYYPDPRYEPLVGDSTEIGKTWQTKVDMVFVDGDHSYEHCKSDILSWLPHIKPGGVIALHDYHKDVWPGVAQATDETLGKFSVISHASTFIAFKV